MARGGEWRRSVGVDIEPGRPGKPIWGSTRRLMAPFYHWAGERVNSVRISQFQSKNKMIRSGCDVSHRPKRSTDQLWVEGETVFEGEISFEGEFASRQDQLRGQDQVRGRDQLRGQDQVRGQDQLRGQEQVRGQDQLSGRDQLRVKPRPASCWAQNMCWAMVE